MPDDFLFPKKQTTTPPSPTNSDPEQHIHFHLRRGVVKAVAVCAAVLLVVGLLASAWYFSKHAKASGPSTPTTQIHSPAPTGSSTTTTQPTLPPPVTIPNPTPAQLLGQGSGAFQQEGGGAQNRVELNATVYKLDNNSVDGPVIFRVQRPNGMWAAWDPAAASSLVGATCFANPSDQTQLVCNQVSGTVQFEPVPYDVGYGGQALPGQAHLYAQVNNNGSNGPNSLVMNFSE